MRPAKEEMMGKFSNYADRDRVEAEGDYASRDLPVPDLPRRVFLPAPRSHHCHGHPALATITRAPPCSCPYKPHHSHLPQTPLLEWMVPALTGCLTRALQQHPTTPECTATSPVSSATSPTFRPTSPKSTSTSMTPTRSEAKPAADHPSHHHHPRGEPAGVLPDYGRDRSYVFWVCMASG